MPKPLSLRNLSLASVLLLLTVAGCSAAPATPPVSAQAGDTPVPLEEVQPPTLPIEPAIDPLPRVRGSVPVEPTLETAAAHPSKVQMRLLLISAVSDDPGLDALKTLCDQVGVPCDTFISSTTPMTPDVLVDAATGNAKYQGIFLTDNQLAYFQGSSYVTSFNADEWNTLWQFERDYGVRQVSIYTYPGTYPESQGLSYTGIAPSTGATPYNTTLTAAGQSVFSSLKANATIPVRYAYTYQASLDATVPSAQALIQDASGRVLGASSTSADGRERLALTMAQSPYLLHSQLLGYDLLRWVTKGVFIGQRQFYLGIDQDDYFSPTDRWDASTGTINGTYRMTARDVVGVVGQQRKLRAAYPFAKDFAWTMAFNGVYANASARRDCNVATTSVDPLTSLTLCYKNEFFWLNHTWNHEFMDAPTTYQLALSEIRNNTQLAQRLGLITPKYGVQSLVTGDISGLGWYAPGGPDTGPKVDYGLEKSNPEFLRAAVDSGVRYVSSNMSTKSQEPVNCWGCGIPNPVNPRIFLVPRWPTNLFVMATTPADMLDQYNRIYGPNGSSPYFPRDLTYTEYLNVEADIALYHIISGSPYQHYQHVGNLREYAPGRSLAYDWVERLLSRYSQYYNQPLLTLKTDALAKVVADRTSFRKAGISGVFDTATRVASVTSANGGVLYLTSGANATITRGSLAAGQTQTFQLP